MTLAPLNGDQAQGADPTRNAWMSASAGTGKTQVLTARIIRLLLAGVRPEAILAITFTKAGAAEMARRVREELASWVRLKDSELSKELWAIKTPGHFDPDLLEHARTLFAAVIEAPGNGLAIQTIHGFCQSLLASFPEEADLAPGFAPMDEREQAQLMGEVLDDLLDHAVERGEPAFPARVGAMAMAMGEEKATAYLQSCARAARALEGLPEGVGPWLRREFGFDADADPEHWLADRCADELIDRRGLGAIAAACVDWSTKTGDGHAAAIEAWLAREPAERAATLDTLLAVFVTQKGDIRADFIKGKLASVRDLAERIVETIGADARAARAMAATDRLAEALGAGRSFARAYAARKRAEGKVDFDDMIEQVVALLAEPGRAEWIRYKLDQRIDHILVDEAQDTNRAQWQIVESLVEEFFAGEGASHPDQRTLFVVGDFKQAIFGFQGTSPQNFAHARRRLFLRGDYGDRPFADLGISTNYRSSPPVLALVDQVIAELGPAALGLEEGVVNHAAFAADAGGRVTLWPAVERPAEAEQAEDDDEETGWIDSATREVANRIALSVRQWVDEGIGGEPVKPGDVLVLVRKRAELASLIVSRLQAAGVPVAGVDRLRLGNPLAVQDLLSAARFALQPLDDLNLAALLTSPLVGWSHDRLIEHGWRLDADGRQTDALWPHLRWQEGLRAELQPLVDLLGAAGYLSPYQFFEHLLSGPMQGRARLLARLGNAARDPIEALVSEALAFETREGHSLHHFLAWFDASTAELKREQDHISDEVRVMTVHGAKGLQSRIVILADATVDPKSSASRGGNWTHEGRELPLIALPAGDRPEALAKAMAEQEKDEHAEHWRLLYVALTRAERMLFVTGALGARASEPPPESWYTAIAGALDTLGAVPQEDVPIWGHATVYEEAPRRRGVTRKEQAPQSPVAIPDWAMRPAPAEPRPLRPLAPSSIGEGDALAEPVQPMSEAQQAAIRRGRLMHALFERLPGTPPARREAAGAAWLAAADPSLDATTQAAMLAQVLAVLDDPRHAALFGPGSLAEVPFSALVDGRVIAGTVDRLIVDDRLVRVIDYKTGSNVPATVAAIGAGYMRQMAAYVATLRVIFPDHRVEAALLFTSGPRLFDLSDTDLAPHKPDFAAAKTNDASAA